MRPLGFAPINALVSRDQSFSACIGSRITTGIHVDTVKIKQITADLMSRLRFHDKNRMYLDMHGLIFEINTSVQAGSTRYLNFILTKTF